MDARISDDAMGASPSSCTAMAPLSKNLRKMVMDALPSLIEACRLSALEYVGSESVFAVLSRADDWTTDIENIVESSSQINTDDAGDEESTSTQFVLGRRLIHSHHTIAQSKRKAIVELAHQ